MVILKFNKLKVIGFGVLAITLSACSTSQKQNETSGQNSDQNQPSETSNAIDEVNSVVIAYSDSGFAPASINAKVGQEVVFKNNSTKELQVNSAPHPAHTLYQELNIGEISEGESKSTTFAKAGSYKYHNHLNASEYGSIVVE